MRFATLIPLAALAALTSCGDDAATDGSGGLAAGGGQSGAGGSGSAPVDAAPEPCGCFFGNGRYCAKRAKTLASEVGCTLGAALDTATNGNLLSCAGGVWTIAEACNSGACRYDAALKELSDACVCDCFVKEAWCGAGVAKEAETLDCAVPLLPEHADDILYCPNGKWTVKQACAKGCVQAPVGTPDFCKT